MRRPPIFSISVDAGGSIYSHWSDLSPNAGVKQYAEKERMQEAVSKLTARSCAALLGWLQLVSAHGKMVHC